VRCNCGIQTGEAACPVCGTPTHEIRDTTSGTWRARVQGTEYPSDFTSLKSWVLEGRISPTDQVQAPGSEEWVQIQDVPGLLVPITTGDLAVPYEPIDAVFAIGSHSYSDLFGGPKGDPNLAFDGVKQSLRRLCRSRGGDAVVNCQFEYRLAVSSGLLAANQVVEIFAYGTAVRFSSRP
jgi:hypothetical protein